jgi:hypothetical protein
MSLFDDASLVMIPSAYKDGKLYSIKPTDGSGDFTFSRSTAATRVNADGLIESVTDNVPRLDYTDSSCPALKLEPQRTNLIEYSEAFDNAYWTKTGSSVVSGFASPSADSPLGAFKLVEDSSSGIHRVGRATFTSGIQRTLSVFAKKGERDYVSLFDNNTLGSQLKGVIFNLNTGALSLNNDAAYYLNPTTKSFGNGWYLFSVTWTPISLSVPSVGASIDGLTNSYTGNGTSGIYVAFAQLEQGSLTSYIPTYGTSVTRSKDSCIKTGISSLIGQTEGTLFAEFEIPVNTQNGDIIAIRNGAGSANGIFVSYRSSSVVQLIVRTSSTNALIFQRIGSYPSGKNKIAVAYKNGDFAISLNGTAAQVNTSSITMPTSLDSVALFGDNLYAQTLPVPYAQVLLFKTRLTNAELADLTTI